MPEDLIGAPAPVAINTKRVLLALTGSLLVHATALLVLHASLVDEPTDRPLATPRSLRLHMAAAPEPMLRDRLEEIEITATPISGLRVKPRENSPRQPTIPAPLQITADSIRSAIWQSANPEPADDRTSDNGASVFHPALRHTLNAAQRRTGLVADALLPDMDTSFSGSAWTDLVRIGDACFEINRGDPLDSTSREMWFRVACRR